MSLQLLVRERPQRSLALVTDTRALILRYSQPSLTVELSSIGPSGRLLASRCIVEFSALEDIDLTDYQLLHASGIHGTLGLIEINTDVFLCVISGAIKVATVRPNETVQRILSVEFCQYSFHEKIYGSIDLLFKTA